MGVKGLVCLFDLHLIPHPHLMTKWESKAWFALLISIGTPFDLRSPPEDQLVVKGLVCFFDLRLIAIRSPIPT